ncbi:alpha-1,2-mannosyltransferase ALG9-like [Lineus longissimus]|uniref:alpha-1,2-mannosyltransferase ALG9-like n=1 Tax=Lineus longissimus TaxID=88925 RepID=UPI00315DFA1A
MPSGYTAFKALMSARLCAAIWSNLSDCDETYNYWEPAHYLLYGKGFQTWEYSPIYAIRSYAYLWLHVLPLKVYVGAFLPNKILVFYFMRCILGFSCALCEVYFYKGVCRQFGANTGRLALCILLLSTGMFISCSAFLPSSFAMYMTMLAMGGWFLNHTWAAILAVAASTIIGWPFAGIIGVPIAIDIIWRQKNVFYFIQWCAIAIFLFLLPVTIIDSQLYGKIVIAPLNIVLYNIFSDHGPNIYGVESWTFYFMNGFLNFNIIFIFALISLPVIYGAKYVLNLKEKGLPVYLALSGMYLWMLIFFTRPHKEERFLFPIYPLIGMAGALTVDYIQKMYCYLLIRRPVFTHYTDYTSWMSVLVAGLFAIISVSRTLALYRGYHAPLDTYLELHRIANNDRIHTLPSDKTVNVCVGKEWYRFPSSFFLNNENWNLQFLQSEFKGQLPKQYGKGPDATKVIPSHMNDLNLEEPSRYFDVNKCHYLIDLDASEETAREPRYVMNTTNWKVLASSHFMDASRSHQFFRAFYIPLLTDRYCTYTSYNILKTTRTKSKKKARSKS